MGERLTKPIISSIESGYIADELLKLAPEENSPYYEREAFILGPMSAIRTVFKFYSPEDQNKFRKGIVEGLKKWKKKQIDNGTFARLAYLAGDTKATSAIPILIEAAEDKSRNLIKDVITMQAVISVPGWLCKDSDEKTREKYLEKLKRWYYDPYYEKYVAMMMNGYSSFRPDEFPEMFPRFLEVSQRQEFVLDACIRSSIRVVTPEKMRGMLHRFDPNARVLIEEQLTKAKNTKEK